MGKGSWSTLTRSWRGDYQGLSRSHDLNSCFLEALATITDLTILQVVQNPTGQWDCSPLFTPTMAGECWPFLPWFAGWRCPKDGIPQVELFGPQLGILRQRGGVWHLAAAESCSHDGCTALRRGLGMKGAGCDQGWLHQEFDC